jgi:hypothetical protein
LQSFEAAAEAFLAVGVVAPGQGPVRDATTAPAGVSIGEPLLQLGTDPIKLGFIAFDPDTKRVVYFQAIRPSPPLPDGFTPREATKDAALAFARAHAPELFAAGGEVVAEADIKPHEASWLWRLQRFEKGLGLPLRAEVGVRIYDGKISRWRLEQGQLTVPLDGVLRHDALKAAVAKALPAGQEVRTWLDEQLSTPLFDGKPRTVWVVTVDVLLKTAPFPKRVENLQEFTFDAKSGEKLGFKLKQMVPDLWDWYLAKGGTGTAPFRIVPKSLYTDSRPRFSPDGQRLAFLSTRPRPGYPEWLERQAALFVARADGTGLVCVEPGMVAGFAWSPDGGSLAWFTGGELAVVELASGKRQSISAKLLPPIEDAGLPPWFAAVTWPAPRRLVVLSSGGSLQAMVVADLDHPEAKLVECKLPASVPRDERTIKAVGTDRGGRCLVMSGPGTALFNATLCRLWQIDPAKPEAEPQKVAEHLPAAKDFAPGPDGKLMLIRQEAPPLPSRFVFDAATGQATPYDVPRPPRSAFPPSDFILSPDGGRAAWVNWSWSGKADEPGAYALFVGPPTLIADKPLLPPTRELAPVLKAP